MGVVLYGICIGIRDFGFYFPKNSGGLNRVLLFQYNSCIFRLFIVSFTKNQVLITYMYAGR